MPALRFQKGVAETTGDKNPARSETRRGRGDADDQTLIASRTAFFRCGYGNPEGLLMP